MKTPTTLIILTILSLNLVSATYQLVYLEKGQTLKFSLCNPAMSDWTCQKDRCQYGCVKVIAENIYCPTNPDNCQDLTYSELAPYTEPDNNSTDIPTDNSEKDTSTKSSSSNKISIPEDSSTEKTPISYSTNTTTDELKLKPTQKQDNSKTIITLLIIITILLGIYLFSMKSAFFSNNPRSNNSNNKQK